MTEPAWLTKARSYIGFHEQGNNHGLEEFINLAHTGSEGDPWCAIFANACLEAVGIAGTRSPAAISFSQSTNFVRQQSPQLGTICVFTRTGGNHVAFYTGADPHGRLLILGGNQADQVCIEPHATEGLVGYFWPAHDAAQTAPVVSSAVSSNFAACLPLLLVSEGGNDDDPRDPGGRTSRGILQREWDVWRKSHPDLPSDVWHAPDSEVAAIYRASYWNALQCDLLPAGVDYAVFDYGVNSGISRAAKLLQSLVGTDQDGQIGPLTIAATAKLDPVALIGHFCDQRLAFLQSLGTWGTFGHGWSTRVSRVRTDSLAMAAKGKPMTTDTAQPPATDLPAIAGAIPHLDWSTLIGAAQSKQPYVREALLICISAFNTFNPDKKIVLATDAPPPATPLPTVNPAPATSPLQRPSVQLGTLGVAVAGILQVLGLVGNPIGAGATTAGTLATLVPTLIAGVGATGGWSSILKGIGGLAKLFIK